MVIDRNQMEILAKSYICDLPKETPKTEGIMAKGQKVNWHNIKENIKENISVFFTRINLFIHGKGFLTNSDIIKILQNNTFPGKQKHVEHVEMKSLPLGVSDVDEAIPQKTEKFSKLKDNLYQKLEASGDLQKLTESVFFAKMKDKFPNAVVDYGQAPLIFDEKGEPLFGDDGKLLPPPSTEDALKEIGRTKGIRTQKDALEVDYSEESQELLPNQEEAKRAYLESKTEKREKSAREAKEYMKELEAESNMEAVHEGRPSKPEEAQKAPPKPLTKPLTQEQQELSDEWDRNDKWEPVANPLSSGPAPELESEPKQGDERSLQHGNALYPSDGIMESLNEGLDRVVSPKNMADSVTQAEREQSRQAETARTAKTDKLKVPKYSDNVDKQEKNKKPPA